jgi:peptide/nickel transport system substrate-binding protein
MTRPRFLRSTAGAILAAAASVVLVAACGGGTSGGNVHAGASGVYGTVPPATGTPHAGVIKYGMLTADAPTWVLPIITAAANTVYNGFGLNWEMYRPLYYTTNGYEPVETHALSIADDPVYSDGDTTATITLKPSYKWSDGQPVTSQDVLFFYDELKAALAESPANWAAYAPGVGIPDEVASVSTPSASTIVFHLTKAVNPTWFTLDELGSIEPMPAHAWARDSASGKILNFTNPANAKAIYNYLSGQAKDQAAYPTNPLWQVVDGPYRLSAFNATTGSYTLTPNSSYDGPHAAVVSPVQVEGFASETAMFTALKGGSVDIAQIPFEDIPAASSLRSSYYVFGAPTFSFDLVGLNYKDTTGDFDKIISQLYVRQALEHLVDQQGYVSAFMHGAGVQSYGVVPSFPSTPYQPSDAKSDPYPFSLADATSLLKSHGWTVVPGGVDTCQRPGTGADECGAGIPAGTRLAWNLNSYTTVSLIQDEDTDFVSEAAKAGIKITMSPATFDYIVQNDDNPASPGTEDKWAMADWGGFSNSTYPTTLGLFNTTGSTNAGSYSSPVADSLINASVGSADPLAVRNEMAYLTDNLPGIFQPVNDEVFAVARSLSGTSASFESLTQNQIPGEFWYFLK